MSATREALEELDESTLALVVALHLEDVALIELQDHDDDPGSLEMITVGKIYTDELLQYRAIRQFEGEETRLAEASAVAAASAPSPVVCVSCDDRHPADEVWQAPCSHHYCVGCLEQLHRASMTDETLYPPRCCRLEMPWNDVRQKIDDELATVFQEKKEELDMPVGQRTHCSDASCAKFISARAIANDIAVCLACNESTCTMCKAASHDGDCPADTGLHETLRLAEDSGWQRCSRCGSVVDLTFGCHHITCTCRHQFCYLCGEDWKTCRCPQWDEARLLARAQDIVNREPQAANARPADLADRVAQEAQNLLDNHNCDHENWYEADAGNCEECGYEAPYFTFVCEQCHLRVCRRCMEDM